MVDARRDVGTSRTLDLLGDRQAPAVGEHEKLNARWASEHGAALPQRDPRVALNWLDEWLDDGTLAGAAWNGFRALPRNGLYDIADDLGSSGQ